jgi:hypothetical protein
MDGKRQVKEEEEEEEEKGEEEEGIALQPDGAVKV